MLINFSKIFINKMESKYYPIIIIFLLFLFLFIAILIPEKQEINIEKNKGILINSRINTLTLKNFQLQNKFRKINFLNNISTFGSYTLNSSIINTKNTNANNSVIYIPSKYVKILPKENFIRDIEIKGEYLSPLPINDSPMIKNNQYIFNENGRKFGSISEKITVKIFEEFLGYQVETNIRPNFLKNPETGRNLELDMYDQITKIAIEYNGQQHYKYLPKFHKDENEFYKQVKRDELKMKLCQENGINLISIPYTIDSARINKNGDFVYIHKTADEKEKLLYDHLIPLLELLKFE